jgi:hypothetical protein
LIGRLDPTISFSDPSVPAGFPASRAFAAPRMRRKSPQLEREVWSLLSKSMAAKLHRTSFSRTMLVG